MSHVSSISSKRIMIYSRPPSEYVSVQVCQLWALCSSQGAFVILQTVRVQQEQICCQHGCRCRFARRKVNFFQLFDFAVDFPPILIFFFFTVGIKMMQMVSAFFGGEVYRSVLGVGCWNPSAWLCNLGVQALGQLLLLQAWWDSGGWGIHWSSLSPLCFPVLMHSTSTKFALVCRVRKPIRDKSSFIGDTLLPVCSWGPKFLYLSSYFRP